MNGGEHGGAYGRGGEDGVEGGRTEAGGWGQQDVPCRLWL